MIPDLRNFTSARVSLAHTGHALCTSELLKLQLAQAQARQAVHTPLDIQRLAHELAPEETLSVQSQATNRATYLRRPDLGRALDGPSLFLLTQHKAAFDAVFVIADGLSATAVQTHAVPVLASIRSLLTPTDWTFAPLVLAQQARVALSDPIAQALGAQLSVILIGERPGLSAADSLGIYLTYAPKPGLTDAGRNCISNIREEGLSYAASAQTLFFLMTEARRKKLSGVTLKAPDTLPAHESRHSLPNCSETR